MTDDASGDPGELRWGDEDDGDRADGDPVAERRSGEPDDADDSGDADLCRVSDPTCEACQ